MNIALVQWFSKKQSTVETSVFGAEFVAMKHGIDALRGLWYKLKMIGILISGLSYIYGKNISVGPNTSRPESGLRKKSNSVCFYTFHESVSMDESCVEHIPFEECVIDLFDDKNLSWA